MLTESLELSRALGDRWGTAWSQHLLAIIYTFTCEPEPGAIERLQQDSLAIWRELGDRPGELRALVGVCQLLVALGDVDRAEPLSRELLEVAEDAGDLRSRHFACHFLGDCALIRGDCEASEQRYRESLRAALPLGDVLETSFEVQGVGMSAAGRGDLDRGIRLAGAGHALWESIGATLSVRFWDELLDRYIGAARRELGADGEAAWEAGRKLGFDEAVALALGNETEEPG
jgi:hypothetical protein